MLQRATIRKFLPDGSAKFAVTGYRLADLGGFARVFLPEHTTRVHSTGTWTPPGVSVAAFDVSRGFVPHWWRAGEERGFYVDAARAIEISDGDIRYVDLFLDAAYHGGRWQTLDEEELALASPEDAARARVAIGHVLALAAGGDALFDTFGTVWSVPDEALSLPALDPPALG